MKSFRIKYIEDGETHNVVSRGRNVTELQSIFQRTFPNARIVEVERAN